MQVMQPTFAVIGHSEDGDRWLVLREGEDEARVVTLSTSTLSPLITDDMVKDLAPWAPVVTGPAELATIIAIGEEEEEDELTEEEAEKNPENEDDEEDEEDEDEDKQTPETFKILIVDEALVTNDGRSFEMGGLTWRDPPFPVMFTETNTGDGHKGSVLGGTVREAWRGAKDTGEDLASSQIWGRGEYVPGKPGERLKELVNGEFLTGTSADIADAEVDVELSEDGEKTKQHIRSGVIIGTTVLPFPAYGNTRISAEDSVAASGFTVNLVASVGEECTECLPPADWFENPLLTRPTAMTVTDDGRVFGHLATWGVCHTGSPKECLIAPRSASDYAYFRTGATKTREGRFVATGPVTLGTGHAALNLGSQQTLAHYDNSGTGVADVVVGEDAIGIWMAGAVRPSTSPQKVHELRASAPSGDWRRIGGSLDLLAILAVNAPGFPVPRTQAELKGDKPMALVAAGILLSDEEEDTVEDRITRLEAAMSQPVKTVIIAPPEPDDIDERLAAAEQELRALATLVFAPEEITLGMGVPDKVRQGRASRASRTRNVARAGAAVGVMASGLDRAQARKRTTGSYAAEDVEELEQERDDQGRFASGGGGGSDGGGKDDRPEPSAEGRTAAENTIPRYKDETKEETDYRIKGAALRYDKIGSTNPNTESALRQLKVGHIDDVAKVTVTGQAKAGDEHPSGAKTYNVKMTDGTSQKFPRVENGSITGDAMQALQRDVDMRNNS